MRAAKNCIHCGRRFVPAGKRKTCSTECASARFSQNARRLWLDPQYAATMREAARETMAKAWARADFRQAVEQRARRRWQDPGYRAEMSAMSAEMWRRRR